MKKSFTYLNLEGSYKVLILRKNIMARRSRDSRFVLRSPCARRELLGRISRFLSMHNRKYVLLCYISRKENTHTLQQECCHFNTMIHEIKLILTAGNDVFPFGSFGLTTETKISHNPCEGIPLPEHAFYKRTLWVFPQVPFIGYHKTFAEGNPNRRDKGKNKPRSSVCRCIFGVNESCVVG